MFFCYGISNLINERHLLYKHEVQNSYNKQSVNSLCGSRRNLEGQGGSKKYNYTYMGSYATAKHTHRRETIIIND